MTNIKFFSLDNITEIFDFIQNEEKDFYFFYQNGWKNNELLNQLNNKNNISIGYYDNKILSGILFAKKIINNKFFDLELHIIIVATNKRRQKIATKLLKYIETKKYDYILSNIYLEVSVKNIEATRFYEKNGFVFLNYRHNYYKYKNKMLDAKVYMKRIN